LFTPSETAIMKRIFFYDSNSCAISADLFIFTNVQIDSTIAQKQASMQEQNQSNSLRPPPESTSSQCRMKGRCTTGSRSCSTRQTSDSGECRHGSTDAGLTQATAALCVARSSSISSQGHSLASECATYPNIESPVVTNLSE